MKPTDEQLRKFWEKLADEVRHFNQDKHRHYRFGEAWTEDEPPLDLNSIFKYAVPKLEKLGYALFLHPVTKTKRHDAGWNANFTWLEWLGGRRRERVTNDKYESTDKDPALALFWAIYKVIEDES